MDSPVVTVNLLLQDLTRIWSVPTFIWIQTSKLNVIRRCANVAIKRNPLSSIEVHGPVAAHQARAVIEESLRNAILDGRLPCGTAIRQEALADLFGVSRMPVREALRQLESQGLLHVVLVQRCSGGAFD